MATNTNAPNGLLFARNIISNSPTFQANGYKIKRAYGSDIGIGDVVKTLDAGSGSQGYIGLATSVDIAILGVFVGITSAVNGIVGANGGGYYDINSQQYMYGLNGAYKSTILPPVGQDIGALVISDPFAVFRAQLIGVAWSESYRGQNVNFASNGAPNASGISTLYLDGATIALTNTLPFTILGLAGQPGGPQDPSNTNPFVEVRLNTAEVLASAGI